MFFITGNGQGFANSAYLVGRSAVGPIKPFSSMGLLSYLNLPEVTISLTLSCFWVTAGSIVRRLERAI